MSPLEPVTISSEEWRRLAANIDPRTGPDPLGVLREQSLEVTPDAPVVSITPQK